MSPPPRSFGRREEPVDAQDQVVLLPPVMMPPVQLPVILVVDVTALQEAAEQVQQVFYQAARRGIEQALLGCQAAAPDVGSEPSPSTEFTAAADVDPGPTQLADLNR